MVWEPNETSATAWLSVQVQTDDPGTRRTDPTVKWSLEVWGVDGNQAMRDFFNSIPEKARNDRA